MPKKEKRARNNTYIIFLEAALKFPPIILRELYLYFLYRPRHEGSLDLNPQVSEYLELFLVIILIKGLLRDVKERAIIFKIYNHVNCVSI